MKKITTALLFMLTIALGANAQKFTYGDMSVLSNTSYVNLVVDFNKAEIHGMSEKEFYSYEPDYKKDKPGIVGLIYEYAQRKCTGLIHIGRYEDAAYTLVCTINSVSVKGNYVSELKLFDSKGKMIAHVEDIKGKGGVFGTKLNLMKDGAESTGKAIGTLVRDEIRRYL